MLAACPSRAIPEVFWYASTLATIAFSPQPGPAPLVFIIPGTGASYDSGKSLILQRTLYAAGLHVVSLPSPIHPTFIVAASASRRPGLLAEDAEDLYRVMPLIRRQLEDEFAITGYDLAGYSLGATRGRVRRPARRSAALVRLRAGAADQPAGRRRALGAGARPAVRRSTSARSPTSTTCSTS